MSTISELSLPRNRQEVYEFSILHGLIPPAPICRRTCKGHKDPAELFSHNYFGKTDLGIHRCCKQNKCRPDVTVAKGAWFEKSRLSPQKELRFLFYFAHNETYERISSGVGEKVSTATPAARIRYCREMITSSFTQMQLSLPKIGGSGIVVQIDEYKFGKRKYNRGRIVEGHWVLGLIADDSDDSRLIICPANRRDADTLIPIIQQHVERGSIIHTDMWKEYSKLPQCGYRYSTVNHRVEFVASDGNNTQRIEYMNESDSSETT